MSVPACAMLELYGAHPSISKLPLLSRLSSLKLEHKVRTPLPNSVESSWSRLNRGPKFKALCSMIDRQ